MSSGYRETVPSRGLGKSIRDEHTFSLNIHRAVVSEDASADTNQKHPHNNPSDAYNIRMKTGYMCVYRYIHICEFTSRYTHTCTYLRSETRERERQRDREREREGEGEGEGEGERERASESERVRWSHVVQM